VTRSLYWALTVLAISHTIVGAAAFADDRPNVLFIFTDDQSHRTVSAYPQAYPWVETPSIDRLAASGVRFENAYIGTWCMPSRATLLTGLHQFAIESMRMEDEYPGSTYDPEVLHFWPEVFRKNGYVTGQIGKWHTGVDTGFGRDWDYQIVWNRPRYPETADNYYYNQPITYHGGKTEFLRRYATDQYTDWAIQFINGDGRDVDKPWYLWLNYTAAHSPFVPADRHLDEYPGIEVATPLDIFGPRPSKPRWAQNVDQWTRGGTDGTTPTHDGLSLTSWVRQYHQTVLALDEGVGRVIEALEATGQRDKTLIIFASDQGLAWGQHGFRDFKRAAYDATIRGPLIFSMPGNISRNAVVTAPVTGLDIVPTIFEFAGIDLPWNMHGNDLTSLLTNPRSDWPFAAMLVATGDKFGSETNVLPSGKAAMDRHGVVPWYVMLREGRYKYVRPLIEDLEELYDLESDPDELENLVARPEFAETVKRMRAATIAKLREDGARFVDDMPMVTSGK
jgi:arylsulfatase A-like enzyme